MPPDHKLLMKKFQDDEKLRNEFDKKFGDDKEKLLAHLWQTHRTLFRPLQAKSDKSPRIERWLASVSESEPVSDEAQNQPTSEPTAVSDDSHSTGVPESLYL